MAQVTLKCPRCGYTETFEQGSRPWDGLCRRCLVIAIRSVPQMEKQ